MSVKNVYNQLLPFCPVPIHLRVKLDRSHIFCHHRLALPKKLSSSVHLLRRLAGVFVPAAQNSKQFCSIRHPCCPVDESDIKHGVLREYILALCFSTGALLITGSFKPVSTTAWVMLKRS